MGGYNIPIVPPQVMMPQTGPMNVPNDMMNFPQMNPFLNMLMMQSLSSGQGNDPRMQSQLNFQVNLNMPYQELNFWN